MDTTRVLLFPSTFLYTFTRAGRRGVRLRDERVSARKVGNIFLPQSFLFV